MKQAMSGFCIQTEDFHDLNKKASCNATGTKYGRWNPTSEQVKVLTDLFRSGLRTPSIDQIQKISSELSSYGTIESKNVFYWFQNHKARERQKRQRVTDEGSIVKHVDEPTYCVDDTYEIRPESKTERKTLQLFPVSGDIETGQQVTMPTGPHIENKKSSHPPLDLSLSFY